MHATQAKYELISKIFAERIERDGLLMKDHLAREDHFDERWCAATPPVCVGSVGCGCTGCAAAFCRLLGAAVLVAGHRLLAIAWRRRFEMERHCLR